MCSELCLINFKNSKHGHKNKYQIVFEPTLIPTFGYYHKPHFSKIIITPEKHEAIAKIQFFEIGQRAKESGHPCPTYQCQQFVQA